MKSKAHIAITTKFESVDENIYFFLIHGYIWIFIGLFLLNKKLFL